MARRSKTNHKVMACFDTETTNDVDNKKAFAICYQLSVLFHHDFPLDKVTNDNAKILLNISIDRHFDDVCKRFDELIMYGKVNGITPVVMVHNLSFEMWILSSYISKHEASGCSKSTVKPLTINILEDGVPVLIFWDTLSFWGKSLSVLGDECGYPKLSGAWDYQKYRTPDTELTEMELAYATEDVVVPWAYMGYYLRMNPELPENELAAKLMTKTSVVRYKSVKRCGHINVNGKTTSHMWTLQNRQELPTSDKMLEYMHGCTRGGFTYCSSNSASVPYHSDRLNVYKYDANSMHICHALAHRVPRRYRSASANELMLAFRRVECITPEKMLEKYHNPFSRYFFAKFKFTNIRLKAGSIFEKNRVSTLASSRFSDLDNVSKVWEADNAGGIAFTKQINSMGMRDYASPDAVFEFGKFIQASECVLMLNEMSAWEVCMQFDWDNIECVEEGFITGQTTFATDKSVLSFNNFFKAKNVVKRLKDKYYDANAILEDIPDFVPDYIGEAIKNHDMSMSTVIEAYYLSVKAELNSLYGIEATNEAKNEIILTKEGYEVGEYKGIEGLPKTPKAWYQYGMHIVGWSRIHQILFMYLLSDEVEAFICGDTDSHKIYTAMNSEQIAEKLKPLHEACDRSIEICTERARKCSEWYPMKELGWYECEGRVDAFYAAWNKCYMEMTDCKIKITMAGVPTNRKILVNGVEKTLDIVLLQIISYRMANLLTA